MPHWNKNAKDNLQETNNNGMKNLQDWLALYFAPGIGSAACRRLIDHFGDPARVFTAGRRELMLVPGLRRKTMESLVKADRNYLYDSAAGELEKSRREHIKILTLDCPAYPEYLRNIYNPPPLLYIKGDPELLHGPGLGVVGSRAATSYGRRIANKLSFDLARQGFTIVSGLALGIDEQAHRGALAAGGKTIAVLGCGLDIVYPQANNKLFQKIAEAGALVSEYPLGTKPEGYRFPPRNRIISGLALGVLVVEATIRSGSLITAKHAIEQGREVFAIPGRIDSVKSAGTHSLLQQGAKLVHSMSDIVEELPAIHEQNNATPRQRNDEKKLPNPLDSLELQEKKIYSVLEAYPKDIDGIVRESGLTAQKVCEGLLLLELKGLIEALPGKSYQKT